MGSLEQKVNAPSYNQIGKKLHLNLRSVCSVIKRYKKLNGYTFPEPMKRENKIIDQEKNMKRCKLNQEEMKYILDPAKLDEWKAYSLNKRCALIYNKFKKKITRVTLAKYYKRNKIRFKKPEYTIHTDQKDEEIHQQRLEFVPKLLKCYKRKIEVIYIDECTTNVWQKPNRIWMPRDNPLKIKLAT